MSERYGDAVEFLWVYSQETHPVNGWRRPSNDEDGVFLDQTTTIDERTAAAAAACDALPLSMPCLIDDMDDSVMRAYAGWPDRIVLIDKTGSVRYVSERGPIGFRPDLADRFITAWLRGR